MGKRRSPLKATELAISGRWVEPIFNAQTAQELVCATCLSKREQSNCAHGAFKQNATQQDFETLAESLNHLATRYSTAAADAKNLPTKAGMKAHLSQIVKISEALLIALTNRQDNDQPAWHEIDDYLQTVLADAALSALRSMRANESGFELWELKADPSQALDLFGINSSDEHNVIRQLKILRAAAKAGKDYLRVPRPPSLPARLALLADHYQRLTGLAPKRAADNNTSAFSRFCSAFFQISKLETLTPDSIRTNVSRALNERQKALNN